MSVFFPEFDSGNSACESDQVVDSWEFIYDEIKKDQIQRKAEVYNKVYQKKVQITSMDLFCLIFSFLDINKYEYIVHQLFKHDKQMILDYWKRHTHYMCLYEKGKYSDIIYKTYYRNGKQHNEDDLPAYEVDEFMMRRIKMWYANGKLHRVGKPAVVEIIEVDTEDEEASKNHCYWEKGIWKYSYTYYKNGRISYVSPTEYIPYV